MSVPSTAHGDQGDDSWDRLLGAYARNDDTALKTGRPARLEDIRIWLGAYLARRLPGSLVEDVVQDTLLAAHRGLAAYDPVRPPRPWLATIARHKAIDWSRAARDTLNPSEDMAGRDLALEDHERAVVARLVLERLMAVLPETQRFALRMTKLEGLGLADVAAATGRSIGSVKVDVHRAMSRLSALVEDAGPAWTVQAPTKRSRAA